MEHDGPDGGWGWVVAFGAFLVWVLAGSQSVLFGILFSGFLLEQRTTALTSSMIYNAGKVLSYLGSYLVDPLVEEFGWRRITFTLGLMNGLGLVLSAFATSATYIFFSFSLLVGVPSDMFVTILYAIVPQYFRRRMTLATSLMATGASCSLIMMPVIVTELATAFGFRIAAMITGALSLNCCAASMVFHPVEWHSKTPHSIPGSVTKTEKRKVIRSLEKVAKTAKDNLELLKSVRVIILCLFTSINVVGLSNFLYLVPFAMEDIGYSPEEVEMCVSLSGITLFFSRLVYPPVLIRSKMKHRTGVISGCVVMATAVLGFALADKLLAKAMMMALFGVGTAVFFTSYSLVVVELLGLPMLTPVLSVAGLFKGSLTIIFGPVFGWVRDASGSYIVSLAVVAALDYCSIMLWWFLPAARVLDERVNHFTPTEKEQEQHKANDFETQNEDSEILPLIEKVGRISNGNISNTTE